MTEWIKKQYSMISCLQQNHSSFNNTQTESERVEKYISSKWNLKKAGVAILISDKTEFKKNMVKRNKGHYVMIKGSVHQEDIAIVNIYESYIIVHI